LRKLYQIKISNRFAPLENLNYSKDINRAWENIKKNIKTSAKESLGWYEFKQHKPWFDEEYLQFLNNRKQSKMQWLQNPNQNHVDNLNSVRREDSRYFRNKDKEYLKAKN
jgi:predicted metallo-beta-lactamase superfamily hydrolase